MRPGEGDRGLWSRLYAGEPRWEIRARGREYFDAGAVTLEVAGPARVLATVMGSRLYGVELAAGPAGLGVKCTCPYFDREAEWCKHIWAAILAVDADESGQMRVGPPRAAADAWKEALEALAAASASAGAWLPEHEIGYVVDVPATLEGNGLVLEVTQRQRKANGEWAKPKPAKIPREVIARLPQESDRTILTLLFGARQDPGWGAFYGYETANGGIASRFALSGTLSRTLLPALCATGRCRLRASGEEADSRALAWSEGPPWQLWLEVRARREEYVVEGSLRREPERRKLGEPVLLTSGGLVFWDHEAALLDDGGAFSWIALLRRDGSLRVPSADGWKLVGALCAFPQRLRADWPEELEVETVPCEPKPRVRIAPFSRGFGRDRLRCELLFDYGAATVSRQAPGWAVFDERGRRLLVRDESAEQQAYRRLREVGVRMIRGYDRNAAPQLEIVPTRLPGAVRSLLADGWQVEAEGRIHRPAGNWRAAVRSSGIDWFELEGSVSFGDEDVPFPTVLAALRKGETTIRLGDGAQGVLPEEWLRRLDLVAGLATSEEGAVRIHRSQAGLLDAILSDEPHVTFDRAFGEAREKLRRCDGLQPAEAPGSFRGELRGYQKEGLGWLLFLEEFGFGGCLADDMGLGKTVQALAFLEARGSRLGGEGEEAPMPSGPATTLERPSLVVAPRSLLFNWKEEAARFTPRLAIHDHSGPARLRDAESLQRRGGVVLTTYGTLRRDVALLSSVEFDCVVLDEAQAIKNSGSESAKAARRLKARLRLALSGTPIENHLGELWSLLEFLNPGMLGRSRAFRSAAENGSEAYRAVLARGLKPFILRRTKEQVASDLPARTEQTILCDLDSDQRRVYDELKRHYRRSLLPGVARDGIAKSKIRILEALLRLRQAACHPGLIDPSRKREGCAKLDTLLPQLSEVLEEGHKALVFSQFTSFLGILRPRLDGLGIAYEYLDGKTSDRASRVRRFQEDPDCGLFLISLKAGGLGLNLTAAEYVFLLDPWWNPAVEAQAVDRAHRIGQTRPVFAYRLIARDTVEEKVVALQETKRRLADAILGADKSLIRDLRPEDLEILLS